MGPFVGPNGEVRSSCVLQSMFRLALLCACTSKCRWHLHAACLLSLLRLPQMVLDMHHAATAHRSSSPPWQGPFDHKELVKELMGLPHDEAEKRVSTVSSMIRWWWWLWKHDGGGPSMMAAEAWWGSAHVARELNAAVPCMAAG